MEPTLAEENSTQQRQQQQQQPWIAWTELWGPWTEPWERWTEVWILEWITEWTEQWTEVELEEEWVEWWIITDQLQCLPVLPDRCTDAADPPAEECHQTEVAPATTR